MPELMVILKKFFAYNDKKLELSVGAYSAKGYSMIETTKEEAGGVCLRGLHSIHHKKIMFLDQFCTRSDRDAPVLKTPDVQC